MALDAVINSVQILNIKRRKWMRHRERGRVWK